jgi:hypothetical protein
VGLQELGHELRREGRNATVIRSRTLMKRSVRSARAIVSTQKWWFIQMIPMVRKLVA